MRSQIESLNGEIARLKLELSKEQEWREKVETSNRKLICEKRDLLAQ